MSGATARHGRRRRILQEEVLNASREQPAYAPNDSTKADGGEGRRYAFAEGSLGEALAKRHFPNHVMVPVGMALGSAVLISALTVLHQHRHAIDEIAGGPWLALLDVTKATSLATWFTSATMLVAALLGVMVLAVRRRRVDDYRGSHRLWRWAVLVAVLLSIDAATNLHSTIAAAVSGFTGLELLSGGAEWWLVGGGLVLAWVGTRVLLDIKESPLALAAFVGAIVVGGVAVVWPLAGFAADEQSSLAVAETAQLSCFALITTSVVAYMRFLRRDVAAGVATKPQKRTTEARLYKPADMQTSSESAEGSKQDQPSSSQQRRTAKAKAQQAKQETQPSTIQWTDGSDGHADEYEDGPQTRKLSKSERKRMRKLKAERRAA